VIGFNFKTGKKSNFSINLFAIERPKNGYFDAGLGLGEESVLFIPDLK
jgi:hypothetical protein